MKRKFVLLIVILTVLAGWNSAKAIYTPDWQGNEGSTHQNWTFDTDASPAVPETLINDYGTATAAFTVGAMGSGWLDDIGLGMTGIWDIGGTDGSIMLDIDNRPLPLDYKEVWVQMVYYVAMGDSPSIDVPGAEFVSKDTELVMADEIMPGAGWYLEKTVWRIEPNPSHEQIVLTGDINGSIIDQLVVDTYCTPEPASLALLLAGGMAVLRKRRK